MSDMAVVLAGKVNGKCSTKDSCCYGLDDSPRFPTEAATIYSCLREGGVNADFYDGNVFGEEAILKEISKKRPDTILTYVYTPYIRYKGKFMSELSKYCKKLILVPNPFFWQDKIRSDYPFVDEVVKEEENFFGLDVEETSIRYEDLSVKFYVRRLKAAFPILFTKYCPYGCTYCNVRRTKRRERKVEILLEEIKELHTAYGIKSFYLQDNQITHVPKRLRDLCLGFQGLEMDFGWSSDGRVNETKEETLRLLMESKCTGLLFGVESANEEILHKIQKQISLDDVFAVAEAHHRLGMDFRFSFMFGFPWDSRQTWDEMYQLIKRTKPTVAALGPVGAYPSTPLFKEMCELGLVTEEELDFINFSWESLRVNPIPTLYLSKEELARLYHEIELKILRLHLTTPSMLKYTIVNRLRASGIGGVLRLPLDFIRKKLSGRFYYG